MAGLLKRLSSLLRPPEPDDPAEAADARYIHWVLVGSFLALLFLVVASPWLAPQPAETLLLYIPALAVSIGSYWLFRRGHRRAVGVVYTSFLWLLCAGAIFLFGLRSTLHTFMVVIILAAGVFWSVRAAVVFAGMTSVVALLFLFAQDAGLAVGRLHASDARIWVGLSIAAGFTAFVVNLTQRATQRALQHATESAKAAVASEEALARGERNQALLIEQAPDGIVLFEPTGVVCSLNPAAERLFGCPAARVVGKRLDRVFALPAGQWVRVARTFVRSIRGIDAQRCEVDLIHEDGTRIPVEASLQAMVRSDGTPGVQATLRDISDRRRAEEERLALEDQLRHTQRVDALGRLAGGVAHDFNNLLTVVLTNVDLLLMDRSISKETRASGDEIRGAARRGATLVSQLLAFGRRQVSKPRVIDVRDTVLQLQKMVLRLLGEDIELMVTVAAKPTLVRADPRQLEQVLINLAVNARDAMLGGGRLEIKVQNVELDQSFASRHLEVAPGHYLQLLVEDSGTGIDEETMPKIFEPFFTTKEHGQGTGLGLSTVHGIVKQSSGHILVHSRPGEGTRFEILLPTVEGEVTKSIDLGVYRSEKSTGTETILVVEDEKPVRDVARRVLERAGYSVLVAGNAEEAMMLAAQARVELLLTDLVMPKVRGDELAERLLARDPGLRVLFMSGYAHRPVHGPDGTSEEVNFLKKPFAPAVLRSKVREILDA